ncbi:presequence protease, partial [Tremellales sp. Uapishka_1]
MASTVDYGHFTLLSSFPIEYAPVTVSKWRSEKTGLTVVVASHDAPIINGYFVVASEIFDDTGRPHTLEHLVFLGSNKYPYKGVLDQLANRAGSNGTNAWTANDHTAYTIATAGAAGFLEMLPDAGFVTEVSISLAAASDDHQVHHINGSAEDTGVVYSEMQARENQSGDRMALEMQRMLYPMSSAYRSETGGLLQKLRVLTVEQIREYHAKYYVPHNVSHLSRSLLIVQLCLHMDGSIPLPELFDILNSKVDPMILARQQASGGIPAGWKRPFVETSTADPISLTTSETQVIEFMEKDESIGEVNIVFLGPPPTDYLENTALDILATYLTSSATAPIQKEFIEIPKPLATSIGFYSEDRVNKNEYTCYISDVPAKHLMEIGPLLKAKLQKIVDQEGIDMERMGLVLRRDKRKMLNRMETSITDVLCDAVIGDFLYGDKDGRELPKAFEDLQVYDTLMAWKQERWITLLDTYFVSPPSITAIGKPSAVLANKIEKDEKERVSAQKDSLGEEGLKRLEAKLAAAKKESDRPIPEEMLTEFPITDPSSITWVPVETAVNQVQGQHVASDDGQVQAHLDQDGKPLPYMAHFAHVKSAFFSLGVQRADGTVLSHEEVVNQLNDFTVSQSVSWDVRGSFAELFGVGLKVEKAQYEEAVAWIRDLVSGSIFSKDRLSVIVAQQFQELPQQKRSGSSIARAYVNDLAFDRKKSPSEACSLLNLLEFLPVVKDLLESDPDEVIRRMEAAREQLLNPSGMRVSVTGDILDIPAPRSILRKSFLPIMEVTPLSTVSTSALSLTELGKNPAKKCIVVPMSAIEGSYSNHFAKGVTGWDHPDLPALQLATQVLNALESYLWRSIRGAGLAYGAHVEVDQESGLVGFGVYRSPNAMLAYQEAGKILQGLADGSASTAFLNEGLKGLSKNHEQELLKKLPSVTLPEIKAVISKYLLPIFSPDTAFGAVSVSLGKADEVEAGFKNMGFETERRELPTLGVDEDSEGSEGSEGSEESEDASESEEDSASKAGL